MGRFTYDALAIPFRMAAVLVGGLFGLLWWAIRRLDTLGRAEIVPEVRNFDSQPPPPYGVQPVPPPPPGRVTVSGYHREPRP